MAHVLATFAQFERRLISQRTREALAVKRSQGVRLGRPTAMPKKAVGRIKRERAAGKTFAEIADRLNADGVRTTLGGRRWYSATVRYTLNRSS